MKHLTHQGRILLFGAFFLSLISWDRVSKDLARGHLRNQPARSFFHNTLRLEYVENTGAAMSFADNLSPRSSFWLLGILPFAALLGLIAYLFTRSRDIRGSRLMALTLIVAGGMGNILDRLLFDRHVTDFINVGLPILRMGIFNFADVWITVGAAWVIVDSMKRRKV
jgi:signal peptidase II